MQDVYCVGRVLPWHVVGNLASSSCTICHGHGCVYPYGTAVPCHCACRKIFRAVLKKREHVLELQSLEATHACMIWSSRFWHRPQEEFLADVDLVVKRAIVLFPRWRRLIEAKLSAECLTAQFQGKQFWHDVYRVEVVLGKAFLASGLYPTQDYFAKTRPKENLKVAVAGQNIFAEGAHFGTQL